MSGRSRRGGSRFESFLGLHLQSAVKGFLESRGFVVIYNPYITLDRGVTIRPDVLAFRGDCRLLIEVKYLSDDRSFKLPRDKTELYILAAEAVGATPLLCVLGPKTRGARCIDMRDALRVTRREYIYPQDYIATRGVPVDDACTHR